MSSNFERFLDELAENARLADQVRAQRSGKAKATTTRTRRLRKASSGGGFAKLLSDLDALQKASQADSAAIAKQRRQTQRMLKASGAQLSGPREVLNKAMAEFQQGRMTAEDISRLEATCHRIFR